MALSPDLWLVLLVAALFTLHARSRGWSKWLVRYCSFSLAVRLGFIAVYSVLFICAGYWLRPDLPALLRLQYAIVLGLMHSLVWSPAIGIVLSVMQWYRLRHPAAEPSGITGS